MPIPKRDIRLVGRALGRGDVLAVEFHRPVVEGGLAVGAVRDEDFKMVR